MSPLQKLIAENAESAEIFFMLCVLCGLCDKEPFLQWSQKWEKTHEEASRWNANRSAT
jgi:hypothetical protein